MLNLREFDKVEVTNLLKDGETSALQVYLLPQRIQYMFVSTSLAEDGKCFFLIYVKRPQKKTCAENNDSLNALDFL